MSSRICDSGPVDRAISICLLLLFTGKRYTLKELADEFGCYKSRILATMRYIEASPRFELEVEKKGREVCYRIKAPDVVRHPGVLPENLQQLVLCRDMLYLFLPKSMRERMETMLGASAMLLQDFNTREEALTSVARGVAKGRVDYEPQAALLDLAQQAIREHRVCRLRYRSLDSDADREHYFAPLALVSREGSFYLRGIKTEGHRGRYAEIGPMFLVMQRIQELNLLSAKHDFTLPPEPPGETFGLWKGEPFRVRARFWDSAATYVRERIWSTDQTLEDQADGSLILEFTSTSVPESIALLLSFGPSAECLSPADLRAEVAQRVGEMAKRYTG